MSQFIDWSKFREGKLRVIVRTKEEAIDFINEYLKNTNINVDDFTYEEYFKTLNPEEELFTKEDTLGIVFGTYEDYGGWYYARVTKKNREKYIRDINNTIFWEDTKIEKKEVKETVLNFQEVLQRVSEDGELYLEIRHPLINKQEVYYNSGTFDTILYFIALTFDSSDIVDILLNGEWVVIEDN